MAGTTAVSAAVPGGSAIRDTLFQSPREKAGSPLCAHDAGERIAVGEAEGGKPKRLGLGHQLVGVRAAFQEGEVADRLQLGPGRGRDGWRGGSG